MTEPSPKSRRAVNVETVTVSRDPARRAPLYTLKELRRAIGCSDKLIRAWIKCGLLQGHTIPARGGGVKHIFTIPEIHAFIARFPTTLEMSRNPRQGMADFRKLYGFSRPFLRKRSGMPRRRRT